MKKLQKLLYLLNDSILNIAYLQSFGHFAALTLNFIHKYTFYTLMNLQPISFLSPNAIPNMLTSFPSYFS